MQYALVNNVKTEPTKGKNGICCGCGKKVIAKCGNTKLHHWAHTSTDKCDSWWENETEWHRKWKGHFPLETREVTFYDPVLNEYHRADVHNRNGITIEFQNSPLTIDELTSRNTFYNKIVWIVNGKKFKGFEIMHNIPDPSCDDLKEWDFLNGRHLTFASKSDALEQMVRLYSLNSTELRHLTLSRNHSSFIWKYAHTAWYTSVAPIFIDFGSDQLYWLRRRIQEGQDYMYVQKVSKSSFLEKYSV